MTDILDAPDKYECAVCGHEWSKAAVDEGDHDVDYKVDGTCVMLKSCSLKRACVAPRNVSTPDRRAISSNASSNLALDPDGARG
jgi:hypothetical protein